MNIKRLICLLISILILTSAFSLQSFALEKDNNSIDMNADFSVDHVIVKLSNTKYTRNLGTITNKSFDIDCSEIKLLNPSKTTSFKTKGVFYASAITETQNNTFVLTLKEAGKENVKKAIEILRNNPIIEYAEPDYIATCNAAPNDPSFYLQYGLQKIDATTAWNYTRGSDDVVVGIIDTGIEGTHPDLYDNLWTNPNPNEYGYTNDVHGYNFYADIGGTPTDLNGHGTHVSGIIGAKGNNSIGVSGVNWNVSLAWLGVGIEDTDEMYITDIIEAFNYANLHDIFITNNSYGTYWYSEALEEAVANYKGLVVAAAGNDTINNDIYPSYPASFELSNVISVASTDSYDELSDFSNYGAYSVDIAAPGSDIYSTYLNSSYEYLSGTSMATPQVVGVAALLKSEYPDLTTAQLKSAILDGVDVLSDLNGKVATSGRLNAYKALQAAGTTIDVYFQNTSNWNSVYAYYWSSSGTTPVTWPGTAMTLVSGNIYKVTVPSNCNRIIFSRNGNSQTVDLTIPGNNQLYIPSAGTWIPYNPDDYVTVYFQNSDNWSNPSAYYWEDNGYLYPVSWPGEAMEHCRANIYKVNVPSRCDKIIFSNGGSTQTIDLTIPGNSYIYRFSTSSWEAYNAITDKTITLYFTNTNNWSANKLRAYLWNSTYSNNNGWPGEHMVYAGTNQISESVYSITFDSSTYDSVIFTGVVSGTTVQTVDITGITEYEDGNCYKLNGNYMGNIWNVCIDENWP